MGLSDAVQQYLLRSSVRESSLLRDLREETAALPDSGMQISPEFGQFLSLLVELTGARRALEIGTFTGYSSICIASALPEDGQLTACDVSEEYTRVAQRYWHASGLAPRIDLQLGPAVESLDALIASGAGGSFDFAFIDADKGNYGGYYDRAFELLRVGGLMVFDNVLWGGSVADANRQDASTRAIRALNQRLHADERVSISLVPIGDGAFLARKRA